MQREVDYDIIAARIRELRKNVRKVSQSKMAEAIGMYQPDLSALENNRPGCGIQDLAKLQVIADYLHVTMHYLLFGEGERP